MITPLAERFRDALIALTPATPEAVDAMRPLYDPALVFQDPIQKIDGLERFLEMNRKLLKRMRRLEWQVVTTIADDDRILLEWVMRGAPKMGPKIEVAGVSRALVKDGRIFDHRDYWDVGEMFASSFPGGEKLLHWIRAPLS